jgi:5-(carboxyamino)imidazole ribonucleotide synthase
MKTMQKIGILGGGQLGKMLIQEAVNWNLHCKVLDNDAQAPCSTLAAEFVKGSLQDETTILNFAQDCDLITIEIENVNVEALKKLAAQGKTVYPQPEVIELIQDKRKQKLFYKAHQIPTAEFYLTDKQADLHQHINFLPAVHKLGKDGYDGKGVQKINTSADLHKGFDAPSVLEKMIPFEKEIAVIVARNPKGEMQSFPVVEMVFEPVQNLVEYLFAPANISATAAQKATAIAEKIVEKLGIVGILAVEMFLLPDGEILVNEVAPRPHNSGHHTIEANFTSQYQQHLRAILNLPLGDTSTRTPAAMLNVLGAAGYEGKAYYEGLHTVLAVSGVYVHLYGKSTTKPFRKMGHVTIVGEDLTAIEEKTAIVKQNLRVITQ